MLRLDTFGGALGIIVLSIFGIVALSLAISWLENTARIVACWLKSGCLL